MTHRVVLSLVLFTLAAPPRSYAQSSPHIRVLDPILKELLDHGVQQSPTLRALVDKVEAAPILVFIEGDIRMPIYVGARLNFVTSVNGLRYVRVTIDCTLSPRRQIALLGLGETDPVLFEQIDRAHVTEVDLQGRVLVAPHSWNEKSTVGLENQDIVLRWDEDHFTVVAGKP